MNSSSLKHEGWLYGLAFLIALGFRLIQLGAAPLTDSEATLALQALQIARGQAPVLAPQPGYILLTTVLFSLVNHTNFMARFVPALVGSALVFAPYLFREKIKPLPALILAFLIAIDPGLVGLSRQAGGTMLAAAFLIFAWGMWRNGRLISAGIFAGLALLSGPSVWAGVLTLGITWLFLQGTSPRPAPSAETDTSQTKNDQTKNDQTTLTTYRPALLALLITLFFGGSLFFLAPNGLSAWLSALPAYLSGWTSPAAMSPGNIVLAFVGYESLGIFLTLLALVRGYRTRSRRITRLSLWLAVALLLAIFYRQTSELVWVIIPLLALAAFELARAFDIVSDERVEVGVVVLALLILLAYISFDVAKIAVSPQSHMGVTNVNILGRNMQIAGAPYVILLGAFLIVILCVSFVAFGWSARTARLGTTWAFVLFLGVHALGSAWGASELRLENSLEFWTPDSRPRQEKLLLSSLADISEFSLGHEQAQPVTILGINSPALEWALRDYQVEVISVPDPQTAPAILVTPLMGEPGFPAAYRGQDFTWRQTPQWEVITLPDWIRWLVYRQLPRTEEMIILWARDDLFPDARGTSQ